MQRRGVGDGGIRRHDPEQGRGRLLVREQRRGGDGGGGVAAFRLEQDGRAGDAAGAQLLGHQEAVRLVAHYDRRQEARTHGAAGGLLQDGPLPDEGPQLLRIGLARQRPQPRAGAAREDDRQDRPAGVAVRHAFDPMLWRAGYARAPKKPGPTFTVEGLWRAQAIDLGGCRSSNFI